MYFNLTKIQKYKKQALDVESITRDSWSFPPVHEWEGIFHGWGPYPWILATCRVQDNEDSPSVCFVSLSGPRPPFQYCWRTPPVDFLPYPWIFLHETDNRIHQ